MQLLWFPQSVCDRLDGLARNFIWTRGDLLDMHMVSWQKITRSKRYGSLGVHQSRLTNVTMLGKLVWDLINVVDKLWVRLLITTYSTNVDLMRAPVKRSLALWNALIKTRAHLHEGFTWRVGEGNISFLYAH